MRKPIVQPLIDELKKIQQPRPAPLPKAPEPPPEQAEQDQDAGGGYNPDHTDPQT